MRNRSLLEQLDRQNNVTRTLLPFVSALPIAHLLKEVPEIKPSHLEAFLFPSRPKKRTQKEQRAYWRIKQRERRERKSEPRNQRLVGVWERP